MYSRRLWTVLLIAAAVAALILLAGGLPQLELRPGQPLRLPESDQTGGPQEGPITGLWLQDLPLVLFRVTAIVALVLVLAALVLFIVSPEARRRLIAYLPALAMIILLYFLARAYAPLAGQDVPMPFEAPEAAPPASDSGTAPTGGTPQWAIVLASAGVGLLLAGIVAGTLLLAWRLYRNRASPVRELAEEARQALSALQDGADLKDTVTRCYARMIQVVREQRDIEREQHVTTREFEQRLVGLGLPTAPVRQLTRLFEDVRYGTRPADEQASADAVAALTAIVVACEREG